MKLETPKKPNGLLLTGMLFLTSLFAYADNDPADDLPSGATALPINQTATGDISNSDLDYYKITNNGDFSFIDISFSFQGSSPDASRLRVLGPNGETLLSSQVTDNQYSAAYTISNPPNGAFYYIGVGGGEPSIDGNKSYMLSVNGRVGSINPTSHNSPGAGDSYMVNVTSSKSWTVNNVPVWASVSPMAGTGNGSVTVSVTANSSALSRAASFLIAGATHDLSQLPLKAPITDNDPFDDTFGGATPIAVNQAATGDISNSDVDFFKVTTDSDYPSIDISFKFSGSSPDATRMVVYESDGTTEISNQTTDSNDYSASYSITNPPIGKVYYIRVGGAAPSLDGTKLYDLVVSGMLPPDADKPVLKITGPKKSFKYTKKLKVRFSSTKPLESYRVKWSGSKWKTKDGKGRTSLKFKVPKKILLKKRRITVKIEGTDADGMKSEVVRRKYKRK